MLFLLLIISCSAGIPILADYVRHPGANIVTQSRKEVRQAAIDSVQKLESYSYETVGNMMLRQVESFGILNLLIRLLRWVVSLLG